VSSRRDRVAPESGESGLPLTEMVIKEGLESLLLVAEHRDVKYKRAGRPCRVRGTATQPSDH